MVHDYDHGYSLGYEHARDWGNLPTAQLLTYLASLLEQSSPAASGWLAERDRHAWVIGVIEGILDGWQACPW